MITLLKITASTIIKKIQATLPDLVITGTHGRTGLKHFFLGSTAEKIVRGSLSPVLVVRGNPSWPPKKILVPVDFTEYTSEALLIAEEFKKAINADLIIIPTHGRKLLSHLLMGSIRVFLHSFGPFFLERVFFCQHMFNLIY